MSGDKITGSAAVDLGLAYKSFPADTFDESVEVFLAKLAGRDRSALTTVKRLVTDGLNKDFDIANADETDAVVWRIGGQAGQAGGIGIQEQRGQGMTTAIDAAVLREVAPNGVASIRLNRPGTSNGLNVETLKALHEAVLACHADPRGHGGAAHRSRP